MPPTLVSQTAWSMVRRLVEREWFTARSSACGLVASIYARLPLKGKNSSDEDRKDDMTDSEGSGIGIGSTSIKSATTSATRDDCFALFQQLSSSDQVPMVRRAAASNLASVGSALAGGTIGLTTVSLLSSSSSSSAASEGKDAESVSTRDSRQVELGDVGTASVPPSVPKAITVSCTSQEAGVKAAVALLPILQVFAHDDQDGVRLLAVDGCVALARLINGGMVSLANIDGENTNAATRALTSQILSKYASERASVLGIVAALSKDHSWRVRWSVANRLSELADAFGRQLTTERLLPRFQDLLLDSEAEVKTCAAFRVHDIGKVVGKQSLLDSIMPCVSRLSEDSSEHVRAALSTVILDLAPVLGKDATIDVLLPQFLRYLKDQSSQVRLNVISNLEAVNKVVQLKTLSQSLLPAIRELSTDKTWRVRQAIISFTPKLARQLGADVFDEYPELSDLCLKWLDDPVFAVREAAAENMKKLCELFGPAWADRVLVTRLLTLYGNVSDSSTSMKTGISATSPTNSFQHRMTLLTAMGRLGEAIGPAVLSSRLLPAITALSRDSVPNIRFNVARALQMLISTAKVSEQASVRSLVRPCLTTLSGDSDADVRYYAQKALNSV